MFQITAAVIVVRLRMYVQQMHLKIKDWIYLNALVAECVYITVKTIALQWMQVMLT